MKLAGSVRRRTCRACASVRERAERRQLNADPARRHAKIAAVPLRRAIAAAGDADTKDALQEILAPLEGWVGVKPSTTSIGAPMARGSRRSRTGSGAAS